MLEEALFDGFTELLVARHTVGEAEQFIVTPSAAFNLSAGVSKHLIPCLGNGRLIAYTFLQPLDIGIGVGQIRMAAAPLQFVGGLGPGTAGQLESNDQTNEKSNVACMFHAVTFLNSRSLSG